MNIRARSKSTLASVLAGSIALQPLVASAAIHQVSYIKTESATLQTLDLTANVDFDFDAATPRVINGVPLDRAYVTAVFSSMAQLMFTMTEGRHRVGSVYVYRNNRFGNNVDMKIIGLTRGRSNATASGWQKRDGTSFNFIVDAEGNGYDAPAGLGQTIAHENGHYIYGLYDEYREAGTPLNPADLGAPSQIDTPLDTVMHNQARFVRLSTPADIVATTTTAHSRTFGGSAWETLARDGSLDKYVASGRARTAFPVFSGFVPANAAALTTPVTGWNAAFKVAFLPTPNTVDYYVISRRLTAEQLTASKNAVIAGIRRLPLATTTGLSIRTYPGGELFPTVVLSTAAVRDSAIALVDAITADNSAVDVNTSLDAVLADVNTLYTSGVANLGDAISLNIIATTADNAANTTFADRARLLRVAVNASVLTSGAQPGSSLKRAIAPLDLAANAMRAKATGSTVTLAQLSHATGGHFTDAHRASALTAGVVKAQALSEGSLEATLAEKHVNSLAANGVFEVKTPVLEKTDGKLSFSADWADHNDNSKLRYELKAPDGTRFVPTNALVNQSFGAGNLVTYSFDPLSATAIFEVAANYVGRGGVWTSTVVANAAVNTPIEQEITAESSLRAEIEVIADGTPDPVLTVQLASNRAVQGASATALFYAADGTLALTKAMTDDGKNGDSKPGDGIYSVSLGGLLAAGQYDVLVNVTDGPSGAVFSTNGSTTAGVNTPPEPLGGAFSRSADTLLTITPTSVVEYYVPSLKKYFITGRESDKALLASQPATFVLTGMRFAAGPGASPPAGTVPICRYFFTPPVANSTHFYGTPTDCALVASTFAGNAAVQNEGIDFAVNIPDSAGNCPAAAPVKVYRSFNNRSAQKDGNHRYTVSLARYNQMIAAGYSADGPVFCVASATDATQ